MATDGQLPNGHRNTARAYADAICAFPDEQFKRSDLQPPLQSALDDLKETPVIAVVDQVRTCEIIENIYEVTSEALEEAESTVATRDPVCPCGHSGLRNQGDHYQCGFRACDDQFDRDELGGPIARPDGGHGPVDAAGAEAERAVAEHCGIAIDDVRVRHTRESHPGAGIEALERLVLEWVDRESEAQVRTDGGVGQTDLGRDPTTREIAQHDTDENNRPCCPDCGQYIGASKSGGKPLPDHEATAFGWECSDCELTLPSNCSGAAAPMFNDQMAGIEVVFRDGIPRWVPVPARYVEDDPEVRTDGGRPEHQAVDGGFVCDECGAVRKTPLGMARHRAREERR